MPIDTSRAGRGAVVDSPVRERGQMGAVGPPAEGGSPGPVAESTDGPGLPLPATRTV